MDGRIVDRRVPTVQPTDARLDLGQQLLVLLHFLARWNAHEDELHLLALVRIVGQKLVDRIEPVRNALRVIHPLNGEHDPLVREVHAERLAPGDMLRRVELILESLGVDSDRVDPQVRRMPVAADARQLGFGSEQPQHGAAEVPQIAEGMKPHLIGAQHPLDQLGAVGMTAEDLVRRERRMQEKSDAQPRVDRAEHRGNEHQLVVMNPYEVPVLRPLEHGVGEALVDRAVVIPPMRVVAHVARQVVQQRPDA